MALFILALILFVILDIAIRTIGKKMHENKLKEEREAVLATSLKLDFSREAKTLKRAEVENPTAKILCVDDEQVILDSFRKILVLEGYSVDTVETGKEALGLIQMHHYDFVFTDLKMPEMDGVEVVKAVKHMRPDIDVVIITGYATVETAVECMKFGAMDYVQKPFTENELLSFAKKILIQRQDRIQKQLKPKVHITHLPEASLLSAGEFAIPGGVFIAKNHCWISMEQDGTVKLGIDDFAKKLIGKINDAELPNLGMAIQCGQPLFSLKQGARTITFNSPISGKVMKINSALTKDLERLEITPYDRNWFCVLDAENFDADIINLNIGKSAIAFYQDDISRFVEKIKKILGEKENGKNDRLYLGEMENLEERAWDSLVNEFFRR
jgi:CheY-like chemotaxis protein